MSVTIDDIDDVMMGAQADAMTALDEWQADFFAPVGKRMVRESVRTMPYVAKKAWAEMKPENYQNVLRMVGGTDNGN